MKKKIAALLLVAMMCTLAACGAKDATADDETNDKDTLVVAMELAYPPFETKDADGNPSGVSVDFAKAFGEYIGKDVVIENIAWDGLIPALQTGKADMVMSSMTITDERKEKVDFSEPYANALLALLTNKDSSITSIKDMNVEGHESACVTEVAQGKADGFIYDQLTIYRNWQANLDTTGAVFIPFQEADQWGIAVQKGNTELLDELNEFIEKYTAEGGFDELTDKYLADEKKAFEELGFKWFFDMD